jgi:hypothetical protein
MFLDRSLNALAVATILFFSPVLANAKPHYYTYHRHYGYRDGEQGSSAPYGEQGSSARSCRLDSNPGDPVYFKKADNRCGEPGPGARP